MNELKQTRKLLARRAMGIAASEDLIEWAAIILEAGVDSPNIRILAGLIPSLYQSEIERYFQLSLNDLKIVEPSPEECLRQYARDVAESILSGETAPVEGCNEIYHVYFELNYPEYLRRWDYLDSGLDPDTCDDLTGTDWEQAVLREAKKLCDAGC